MECKEAGSPRVNAEVLVAQRETRIERSRRIDDDLLSVETKNDRGGGGDVGVLRAGVPYVNSMLRALKQ